MPTLRKGDGLARQQTEPGGYGHLDSSQVPEGVESWLLGKGQVLEAPSSLVGEGDFGTEPRPEGGQ